MQGTGSRCDLPHSTYPGLSSFSKPGVLVEKRCCLAWLTAPRAIPGYGPESHELAQKRRAMFDVVGPIGASEMHCPAIPHSPLGGQFMLLKVRPANNVVFLSVILAISPWKCLSKSLPPPRYSQERNKSLDWPEIGDWEVSSGNPLWQLLHLRINAG